jgi:hypothetical protein
MSEGGEARNHEAEVEAEIDRTLADNGWKLDGVIVKVLARRIAALDALRRSPQGDDPALRPGVPGPIDVADAQRIRKARSPQGEDHEAGIPDAALDAAEQAVHACRRYALGHPSRKAIYVEARDEAYDVLKAALPHLSRCPAPHREDHEACPTCEQFERHMADVHGRTPEALDHESAADRPSPERAKVARLRSALERVESHGSGIAVTIAREALAEFGEGP